MVTDTSKIEYDFIGERIPLKSTNLAAVAYDKSQKILEVEFNSGAIYHYYEVPEETYLGLLKQEGCGKYFFAAVKSQGYKFLKLRGTSK